MLAVPIGRRLLMGMAGLNCWECPGRPPLSRSSSSVVASAFVASVHGKNRRSLAFSRCPGLVWRRRELAAAICARIPVAGIISTSALRQRRRLVALRLRPVIAFVASVPGKNRQSLFFGLYVFGVL